LVDHFTRHAREEEGAGDGHQHHPVHQLPDAAHLSLALYCWWIVEAGASKVVVVNGGSIDISRRPRPVTADGH